MIFERATTDLNSMPNVKKICSFDFSFFKNNNGYCWGLVLPAQTVCFILFFTFSAFESSKNRKHFPCCNWSLHWLWIRSNLVMVHFKNWKEDPNSGNVPCLPEGCIKYYEVCSLHIILSIFSFQCIVSRNFNIQSRWCSKHWIDNVKTKFGSIWSLCWFHLFLG